MADIQQYWNKFKQIEEEYIGIEDGIDNFEENELPYNVNDIRVEQKMITIFQVEYWISMVFWICNQNIREIWFGIINGNHCL